MIPGPKDKLEPYRLDISLPGKDIRGDSISVAILIPSEEDLQHQKLSKGPDWDICRISWIMIPCSGPNGVRYWKSLDHFSMMPFGWIPDDGVDFFKQFILYLQERWLRLCVLAKDHLTVRVSWAKPVLGLVDLLIRF
jgi:hypothetical protein